MMGGNIIWYIISFLAAALAGGSEQDAAQVHCKDQATAQSICGIPIPEDMIPIPETQWVIATSMPRDGSAGGLYLIDTRTMDVERVALAGERVDFASSVAEMTETAKCTPPDLEKLVTHGLSLSKGENDIHRLYVVGHGGREAIELFNVDTRLDKPSIHWAGCVPLPEGLEANSVVGLSGGGLMFTSLYDSGETEWPARIDKLASAAPAGGVFEWHADSGLRRFATPPISGPNGIAVSEDGEAVFLAGWGDRTVRRLDRTGAETAPAIELEFLPDNLHWAPDGSLLVAGQKITVDELFSCSASKNAPPYCSQSWSVARINPVAMALLDNWHRPTGKTFGDSTTAIMVDDRLWLGSVSGECIAVVDPLDAAKDDRDPAP